MIDEHIDGALKPELHVYKSMVRLIDYISLSQLSILSLSSDEPGKKMNFTLLQRDYAMLTSYQYL
jgi:hypothetical protein